MTRAWTLFAQAYAELICSVMMFFRSMSAVSLRRYYCLSTLGVIGHVLTQRNNNLLMHLRIHYMQIQCLYLSSQVMWNAAVHAEYLHDHSDYGFDTGNVRFSWE